MPRLPCLTPWARSGLRHSWTVPQSASGAEKAAQHPSGLGGLFGKQWLALRA